MAGMLPEYQQPFATLFARAVHGLVPVHAPFLAGIRTTTVDHLAEENVPGARGGVMGGHSVEARSEVETVAVANTDSDAWYAVLWDTAEQFARSQMQFLLRSLGEASEQAGTAVDMKDAPLTHDTVLDLIERMHFEVDDKGRPIGLALAVSPEIGDRLDRLGPMSVEQDARYQRIISEKRRAQDAAKRVRKLDRRPE